MNDYLAAKRHRKHKREFLVVKLFCSSFVLFVPFCG